MKCYLVITSGEANGYVIGYVFSRKITEAKMIGKLKDPGLNDYTEIRCHIMKGLENKENLFSLQKIKDAFYLSIYNNKNISVLKNLGYTDGETFLLKEEKMEVKKDDYQEKYLISKKGS